MGLQRNFNSPVLLQVSDIKNEHLVLFDGVCNLCNAAIQFIIKNDKKGKFKFASLQSEIAKRIIKEGRIKSVGNGEEPETIIYFEKGKIYLKSTAALKIAKGLQFPCFLLYLFILIPSPLRNFIYDFVSKNRYRWFGKKEECMIPEGTLKGRFID